MANFKALKKIVALATALALVVCFAVSASAAVLTTTTVVQDDVSVSVTVTEVAENANVTYYATKNNAIVHIEQTKAVGTTAEFNFRTDEINLLSDVKIGSTGASAVEDQIPGYTITYGSQEKLIPTETTQVTFDYVPSAEGKLFESATASGNIEGFAATEADGVITVTFTDISSDVVISVSEIDPPPAVTTATAESIEAAGLIVKEGFRIDEIEGETDVAIGDVNADKVGDAKLTVIGKVTSAAEFGIIVSTSEITASAEGISADEFTASYANDAFAGAIKGDDGVFAVQIIDVSDDNSVIPAGEYNTAVYAKDVNGKYVISNVATATVQ